ncbi:MAG: radical SAM protein [Candidatus Omnitrophota bacterium]
MVKKILLINPNFHYFPGWGQTVLDYKQLPLGLAYIASYIKYYFNNQIDVMVCDAALENFDVSNVVNYIGKVNPDVVGISVHTATVTFVRNVVSKVKRLYPQVFVVLGGPHITALPLENLDIADVCVVGEGEHTFAELLQNLKQGLPFDNVNGIAFKKNGNCYMSQKRKLIDNLDELPFPARELFSSSGYKYHYPYKFKNPYYETIITSRGCSFDCDFCLNDKMWDKQVRYRSLDNVYAELEELMKSKELSLVHIGDDNFTGNIERVLEFCHRKQKYFSDLKWICHVRADSLTEILLKEMKKSGCLEVQMGAESGDDEILMNCGKKLKTATIHKASQMLKKAGINNWSTFMIGNEKESESSVEKTIQFAKKIDPTYCSFLFLSPFPGTRCFDRFKAKRYLKTFDWQKYNFHAEPVFETELLSAKKMMQLRKRAYRKFYLRPRIIFRYALVLLKSGQCRLVLANSFLLLRFLLGMIEKRER